MVSYEGNVLNHIGTKRSACLSPNDTIPCFVLILWGFSTIDLETSGHLTILMCLYFSVAF